MRWLPVALFLTTLATIASIVDAGEPWPASAGGGTANKSYGGFDLECANGVCGADKFDGAVTRPTQTLDVDLAESFRITDFSTTDGSAGFYSVQMETGPPERCTPGSTGNADLDIDRADRACRTDGQCPGGTCVAAGTSSTSDFPAIYFNFGQYISAFSNALTTDPVWAYTFNQKDFTSTPTSSQEPGIQVNHEMDYSPFGQGESDPLIALGSGNGWFPAVSERYQQTIRKGCAGQNQNACAYYRPWSYNEAIKGRGDWGSDSASYETLAGRFPTKYDGTEPTRLVDVGGARYGTYTGIKPGVLFDPARETGQNATVDVRTADWIQNSSMIGQFPEALVNDMNRFPGVNGSIHQQVSIGSNIASSFDVDGLYVDLTGPGYFGACDANRTQPMCVGGTDAGEPCEADSHCAGGGAACSGTMPIASPCVTNWQCRDDRDYDDDTGICVHGNGANNAGTNDGVCMDDSSGVIVDPWFCDEPGTLGGASEDCDSGETCIDIQTYYGQYAAVLYGRSTVLDFSDNDGADSIFYFGFCSSDSGGAAEDEGEACITDDDCAGTCDRQDGARYFHNVYANRIRVDISQTTPKIEAKQGTRSDNSTASLSGQTSASRNFTRLYLLSLETDFAGASNQLVNQGAYLLFNQPDGLTGFGTNSNIWNNFSYVTWEDMWETAAVTGGSNFSPPLWLQADLSDMGTGAAHAWDIESAGWDDGNWQWGEGDSVTWHTGTGTGAHATNQFRVKHGGNPSSSTDGQAFMESDVGITAGIANSVFVQADTDGHRATQRTTMKVLSGVTSCLVFVDSDSGGFTACEFLNGSMSCVIGEAC